MKAHIRSVVITLCLFSGSILFGFGCRSSAMSYESIASCSERGGRVERVCVVQDANNFSLCHQYRDVCMGATTSLDGLEAQRQREREGILHPGQRSTPYAEKTEEERLNEWKTMLRRLDMKKVKKDAKKYAKEYPENSWLLGFWCHKGGEQDLPVQFIRGSLYGGVSYRDESGNLPLGNLARIRHIEIVGHYYDLWSWYGSRDPEKFDLVRLEKLSDREFAVVYRLYGVRHPKVLRTYSSSTSEGRAERIAIVKQKSAEVNPAEHIQNPEVFTQCDYKPPR